MRYWSPHFNLMLLSCNILTTSLAFVLRPSYSLPSSLLKLQPLHSTTSTEITTPSSKSTPERRAQRAKQTWSTVALEPTRNTKHIISLNKNNNDDDSSTTTNKRTTKIHDEIKFEEFKAMKGTYFINGLSSCQIGDRMIHPFEAHGYCKSLVFDGKGNIQYTTKIIETPLTKNERANQQVKNRGVMSTVASLDSIWGKLQNALSPSQRDTANLTADLWPPPLSQHHQSNNKKDKIDPMVIVCTDNGEPYALDPYTLETKGLLRHVVPKLSNILNKKSLAHIRIDDERQRIVMCLNTMIIPGNDSKGNVQMEFIELDTNFDLVSRRELTTRFMVFHDWVLTQNYYVVPMNPAFLQWDNILKFVIGSSVGTDVFAMEEESNGEFILIPRHDASQDVKEVPSDSFFNCFHFGPSFEDPETNEMIINGCVFDYYTFGGEMGFDGLKQSFDPVAWGGEGGLAPPPRLDQFVIDMNTFQMKSKERLPVIPVDMPTFNGDAKPLTYSYFLGADRPEGWFPFRQIVKLNVHTKESTVWDAGEKQVVSEPCFVPREKPKSEDDGFVMSIVHDSTSKLSKLFVWDSPTFDNGPIAEITLGGLIPWCVHGSFHPGYNPQP